MARVALVGLWGTPKGVAFAVALPQGQTPSRHFFAGQGRETEAAGRGRSRVGATSRTQASLLSPPFKTCAFKHRDGGKRLVRAVKAKPRGSSCPAAAPSWRPHSSAPARPARRAAHTTHVAGGRTCMLRRGPLLRVLWRREAGRRTRQRRGTWAPGRSPPAPPPALHTPRAARCLSACPSGGRWGSAYVHVCARASACKCVCMRAREQCARHGAHRQRPSVWCSYCLSPAVLLRLAGPLSPTGPHEPPAQ